MRGGSSFGGGVSVDLVRDLLSTDVTSDSTSASDGADEREAEDSTCELSFKDEETVGTTMTLFFFLFAFMSW